MHPSLSDRRFPVGESHDRYPKKETPGAAPTTPGFLACIGAGKAHAGYPSRSELAFAFISEALRARISTKRIVKACLDDGHRGHAIYEHCTDNGGENYVERQIDHARAIVRESSEKLKLPACWSVAPMASTSRRSSRVKSALTCLRQPAT